MDAIDFEGRPPRILIIDDEQVVLDSCAEILLDRPYDIATADDGSRGLNLAREFGPDLVFVDMKMPGISGLEVIDAINRADPSIVTVVITGYATMDSAIAAMKLGASDYIPKPFSPDQFRLIVTRGLEKRRLVLETIALKREKERLRGSFAAIVSHELKSPLIAVQQNLIVLAHQLSSATTDEQQQRLDLMKSRIADLLSMVDTWLRGLSADLDDIRSRFDVVSLSLPIAKAVDSLQPLAIRKAVTVTIEEHGENAYGDEVTLTEVFANVIGNAIKYSHEGGSVVVSTKRLNGKVQIDISDSGVGIPENELPRVFDSFHRADISGLAEGGAGLGLAISRRIISAHNGSVSAQSQVGRGTTFSILLPSEGPEPPHSGSRSARNDQDLVQGGIP